MRRIPRPQRSIDQITLPSHLFRNRVASLSHQSTLASPHLLRATSASFSTSTRRNFLFGERDPKKHKASIRTWQKRFTGDSEPIGSHVDPYDITSPIRIRPEEQGDPEEILEEAQRDEMGDLKEKHVYEEAESGEGLMRIGSEKWIKQMEDAEVGEPLISKLEGELRTPAKVTDVDQLRWIFMKAFSPWYKGHISPRDRKAARLAAEKTDASKLKPKPKSKPRPKTKTLGTTGADLVFEKAASAPQDTSTAPVLGRALVKQAEGKPFDFMSNRPVPRTKPVEVVPEPIASVAEVTIAEEAVFAQKPIALDIGSAVETSRRAIADARYQVLTAFTRRTADAVAELSKEVHGKNIKLREKKKSNTISTLPKPKPEKWRDVALIDPTIKLQIYKNIVSSTNLIISDNNLNSSRTLGELYNHLVAASKPKPTKLYSQIKLEATLYPNKKTPGMEQLTKLSNVTLHKKKITEKQQERKLGRWKVIEYALTERDLPLARPRSKKAEYWLRKA
ncbi:hypothetical protein K491DRAFT_759800 [Lophiostoma macrostomum CBS 122681]|uniref:Large ribosomal subunit protein mL50 n=1 Tax=Lophiostoma macrostomum CBS 122681 TaxID=1314788 RepID=A0A6A6T2Z6_9PLEO|nr:hypothetical protein K491DRAFT_759800 [Lophiostoma macrostomum CBS 122681]